MRSVFALVLAVGLMALLVWVVWDMPAMAENLKAQVIHALPESGVEHNVTAVLLNFRAYDTLLEVCVLLAAVVAGLALRPPLAERRTHETRYDLLLQTFAKWMVPLMVLVAGYLLWAGKHQAGGAFQAGSVLAAAGVLLRLGSLVPPTFMPIHLRHALLIAGVAVFLGVAVGTVLGGRALLDYSPAWAGTLILLIESCLTVSIGFILLGLFDAAPLPSRRIGPAFDRRDPS